MRPSTSPLKNLLARGFLALAFLFAQQTATLHWLSHAIDAAEQANALSSDLSSDLPSDVSSDLSADLLSPDQKSVDGAFGHQAGKGSAPSEHCDECLVLGALGAAAASSLVVLPASFAQHALATAPPAFTSPAPLRLAFRSRAPPILT